MKRIYLITIAVAAVGVAQLAAQNTDSIVITPALINQLADEAQTNNPALRATEKLVEAARENEMSVRTWEDPMVRVGRMAAEKAMRREDGDLVYGVEQKLPLFGKPEAARRVAETETVIEQANADLKFQLVRKELAIAAFQAALAERTVEIAGQDIASLETLLSVAEQRYEARTAMQFEVLRLQNERAKRVQALRTESVLITNAYAQLDRLIGRPLQSYSPALALPEVGPAIFYSEELVDIALRSEPVLKKMRREVELAEAQAEQTRRQRYPDFTVGVEARNYTGSGEFREGMAFVAFNFPWGNRKKYDADFNREKARQQAGELDATDYELEVRNDIHHLVIRIDAARHEALVYRDEIIPRTETAMESAQAAWESNVGSINDVLEARRMLFDAQLMYARAVSDQYQMLSELVLCCGLGDLEALEMIAGKLSVEP
ncbi:MAG: TolC family protein [Verrucomicrobia bacterium]|nr:TolC family protein [Verrucomicrobiota bacterium]